MKKAFLFALAAFCVSAAQAVSLTWTDTAIATDANQSVTLGNASSMTLAVKITLGAVSGRNVSLIGLENFSVLAYSATSGLGANGGKSWSPADVASANATSIIAVTINKAEDSNVATLEFFLNGEKMGWQGKASPTITLTADTQATFYKVDGCLFDEASVYDGVLTADQISDLAACGTTNLNNVPEPTALALLALGVAGLALKRKNA